ncbi:hypothetical protein ACT54F_06740, partial [Leptospira interrogans]
NQNGIDDLEEDDEEEHDQEEDHDHTGVTAFSDKINAVFQFEEDELVFFGFSPLFKDDQIDWPKY